MQTISKMSIKELMLVLFYKLKEKNGEGIDGRTKLQKLMFILKKQFDLPQELSYFKYTYGPYSAVLQNEVDELVAYNLLDENIERKLNLTKYNYTLNGRGEALGKELFENLTLEDKRTVEEMSEEAFRLIRQGLGDIVGKAYDILAQEGL